MAAKPSKSLSLALKYWSNADDRTGRTRFVERAYAPFDPELKIAGQVMNVIADKSFKFLGWKVYHHLDESNQKEEILKFVEHMDKVDRAFCAWIHETMALPALRRCMFCWAVHGL